MRIEKTHSQHGFDDITYYTNPLSPHDHHISLYLKKQKEIKIEASRKVYEKQKSIYDRLYAKNVKLKIGKQYLALIDSTYHPEHLNDRYIFRILAINETYTCINRYLGVRVGMFMDEYSNESDNVFWFNEDGTSLEGTFKIYAISKSEMLSNDDI